MIANTLATGARAAVQRRLAQDAPARECVLMELRSFALSRSSIALAAERRKPRHRNS